MSGRYPTRSTTSLFRGKCSDQRPALQQKHPGGCETTLRLQLRCEHVFGLTVMLNLCSSLMPRHFTIHRTACDL